MLDAAELGRKIDKAEFEDEAPKLRVGLLSCLQELRKAPFPVILVLSGDDPRGCNLALNVLHEWMDPRYLEGHAFPRTGRRDAARPFLWRYWNSMPPSGKIGIYVRAWTKDALSLKLRGKIGDGGFRRLVDHIVRFEQGLCDDGALLLKFWIHLPPAEFKRRLDAPRAEREDRWGLTRAAADSYRTFAEGRALVEETLRDTSRGVALWTAVESTDDRYRNLTVGRLLLDAVRARLAVPPLPPPVAPPPRLAANPTTLLDRVDLTARFDGGDFDKALRRRQADLHRLSRLAHDKGLSTMLVFEGWDAAGKGGAIRRLTTAMEAVHYRVHNIGAPTQEERAHPWLWRFWRRLPEAGHTAIFDRSWYGRVLVERVEGFARENEWRRAYAEINDFEEQILERGGVLEKFWIHIDRDEQLRRFKARESIPFKQYKITSEDYRNRDRWFDYEVAAEEMVRLTDTERAPWRLVAGTDKKWTRLEVLRIVVEALERAVG